MIPCDLDLTPTPFSDRKIISYEIELPPSGKKFGFNSLDYKYFTIPYVIDTTPNSPADNHLLTQANKHVWVIDINV